MLEGKVFNSPNGTLLEHLMGEGARDLSAIAFSASVYNDGTVAGVGRRPWGMVTRPDFSESRVV